MKNFVAHYVDRQGQRHSEIIAATNIVAARENLRDRTNLILRIKPIGLLHGMTTPLLERASGGRISPAKLQRLAHMLGAYLSAGISIQECLRLTADADVRIAPITTNLRSRLAAGQGIEEALRSSQLGFPPAFIAAIHAGAEAGQLAQVFTSESQRLLALQDIQRDLVSSLIYPVALMVMCVFVIFFMLGFIVPQVRASMPDDALIRMGLIPRAIFDTSEALIETPPSLLFGAFVSMILGLLYVYRRTANWRNRMVFHLPSLGPALRSLFAADFCRAFGTMLGASVRTERAWQLACTAASNSYVRERLIVAGNSLLHGTPLSAVAAQAAVFPPDVTALFALGERTGTLPKLLLEAARFHAGEATAQLRKLSGIAAPIIILFAGMIVGVFAVAMMTTILSVNQVYGG